MRTKSEEAKLTRAVEKEIRTGLGPRLATVAAPEDASDGVEPDGGTDEPNGRSGDW